MNNQIKQFIIIVSAVAASALMASLGNTEEQSRYIFICGMLGGILGIVTSRMDGDKNERFKDI